MKIGVMLRSMGEKQGIGVYTKNLMDHLLPLDKKNEYLLFYSNPQFLGQYAQYEHVYEKLVTAPNKLIWDQVKIPLEAKRERVDLIFNTKFTVPLFTRCKTATVLHGSEWYVYPQNYKRLDILYVRLMMPIYQRRADLVVSVSNRARDDICKYTGVAKHKIKTVYLAPHDRFRQPSDETMFQAVREKYNLPDRFILNVGKLYPGKNIKNMLIAYARLHKTIPHKLVIVGETRWKYRDELAPLKVHGLHNDVIFPGWVPQEEMPFLYRMADLFLFPSMYESCSVALLEAMASGCPVVTSNTGGTPEIAGDAAILLDPNDPEAIAAAVHNVLSDAQLRGALIRKGVEQSKRFSWEKCAAETLALFESLNNRDQTH